MIIVGREQKIDFDMQQQRPFFETTKVLWEGSLSSTYWKTVVQPLKLHKIELEDTIWPALSSDQDKIIQLGTTMDSR